HGTVLTDEVIESIKRTRVALKGPITTPVGKGVRSANVTLRKKLDLYANLRPAKTYQGLRSRYENINLTIVRENTEDLYAGIEFQRGTPEQEEIIETIAHTTGTRLNHDSAISIKFISVVATRRIVKFAFEYADRKSTRLNSSHRTISYAVFCLKKKIKDFLNVRCRLALLPFLISCLIWLDLVASLPLIKERILVIILVLHFLILMLGSLLVLMLPLLVWLTLNLKIKKRLLKFN